MEPTTKTCVTLALSFGPHSYFAFWRELFSLKSSRHCDQGQNNTRERARCGKRQEALSGTVQSGSQHGSQHLSQHGSQHETNHLEEFLLCVNGRLRSEYHLMAVSNTTIFCKWIVHFRKCFFPGVAAFLLLNQNFVLVSFPWWGDGWSGSPAGHPLPPQNIASSRSQFPALGTTVLSGFHLAFKGRVPGLPANRYGMTGLRARY